MLSREIIEKLKTNAAAGRGFYTELRPVWDDRFRHPIRDLLDQDRQHVTLLHLGKQLTADDAEHACEVLADWDWTGDAPMRAELTGAGWFWKWKQPSALVGLVNSPALFALRGVMIARMRERGVPFQDRYGYIPHLTTRPDTTLEQLTAMFNVGSVRLTFADVVVRCGDAECGLR